MGCLMLAGVVSAKTPESEWENLEQVTWKRPYTFLLRDQTCVRGQIVALSADAVTVERSGDQSSPLKRADLLRVFEGTDPVDLVYSGRNSWKDIEGIHPREQEYLEVILKDGSEYKGPGGAVSETGVTVNGRKLAKVDVLRVYYLRMKPLLENGKRDIEKKYYIYPEVWPRMHHSARMIAVLLYDSGMPEENGPAACKAH